MEGLHARWLEQLNDLIQGGGVSRESRLKMVARFHSTTNEPGHSATAQTLERN